MEYKLSEMTADEIYSLAKKFLINFSGAEEDLVCEFFRSISDKVFSNIQQENILPLNSVRDIKRFTIGFTNSYRAIKDEVVFEDYLAVQFLKFGFYDIYKLLFRERDKFFMMDNYYFTGYVNKQYRYMLESKENRADSSDGFDNSVLGKYVKINYKYSPNQLEQIKYLLDKLFRYRYVKKDKIKGITFPYRYLLYFREQLNSEDMTHQEFQKLIQLPYEGFQKEISELDKRGVLENFIVRLYEKENLSFNSKEEFENYVKILFCVGSFMENKDEKSSIGIDFGYLRGLLIENKNSIRSRFYSDEEFKTFLISTLKDGASIPFTFQMQFCHDMISLPFDVFDERYPVKREEIKDVMIHFFKEYATKMTSVSVEFWELYHASKITVWKNRAGYHKFIPEIVEIFQKDVFPRFIDDFLVLLLKPQDWYGDTSKDYRVAIGEIPLELWGTPQNFIDYLESKELKDKIKNTSKFIDEFVDFAKKVLAQERFINYRFTYRPAIEKLKDAEKHNSEN